MQYESEDASAAGCRDNCVYSKDEGDGAEICFQQGNYPVVCKCKALPGKFIQGDRFGHRTPQWTYITINTC